MNEPINILEGTKLSSVEFVKDYIQLRFDGPCLTVNAPFEVVVQGYHYRKGASGYRDALCERIGRLVRQALTLPDQEMRLEFEDGSTLSIFLNPEDQISAEAAVLAYGLNNICVW